MDKKLVKKLQQEFSFIPKSNPLFRRNLRAPMYIETDDGWFDLIYHLCLDIQKEIKKNSKLKNFIVVQVKEKLGGLRFYTGAATHEVFELIRKAELESYNICERCGELGILRRNKVWWYKTLCLGCANKELEKEWIPVKLIQDITSLKKK
uniref:Uncharacterized protein n=1 Tax=viral metagenome TaxID=1070528 RepID=A0A6H2A5T8_9ZZZZ